MDHPTYFSTFLSDEVNISQARLDLLMQRVDSVYSALRADSEMGSIVRDKIPQGSWPHRTIIRPRAGTEFDADFLLLLDEVPGWEPHHYPDAVYAALNRHPTYTGMPNGRRTRAVYLEYSPQNDIGCHLDIVPYVIINGRGYIIDRPNNDWETTDPVGFTTWMAERDAITHGNFRKVVRLMKYYKVHRNSFNGVRSIILTTLLGMQVSSWAEAVAPGCYTNVPGTLLKVVTDLDSYLQAHPFKPSIPNPGGDGTTFDHRWAQPTYSNFRDRMNKCAEEMQAASAETDPQASMKLWQDILGPSFRPIAASSSSSGKFDPGSSSSALASRSGKSG